MNKVITEITPLSSQDCFYLIDRYKSKFDYPLHRHAEYELNFVENCKDARRIVGDSVEMLGDYDLALIGGGLEHTWEAYRCTHSRIREITIQFSPDLIDDTFFGKNQMRTLKELFERAKSGVAFEMPAIMRLYGKLDYVTHAQPGFYRVIRILEILYELSVDEHYHELASASFSNKGGGKRFASRVQGRGVHLPKLPATDSASRTRRYGGHDADGFQPILQIENGADRFRLHHRYAARIRRSQTRRQYHVDRGNLLRLRLQQYLEFQPQFQK